MSLALSKVAHIDDFSNPEYRETVDYFGFKELPTRNRKDWENIMALHSFRKMGVLGDVEILGVGAGHEKTIGSLSFYVKRLFATDIYLAPGDWQEWANRDMMIDPASFFPDGINPRRVVFQHVDGRNLPYEDNTFDGIFSSSSIEHFGNEREIRQAVEECCRVLKPGGVAAISTEWKVRGPGNGWDNVQVFDRQRLDRVWLDGIPWTPVDYLDDTLPSVPRVDFLRSVRDDSYAKSVDPHLILQNGIYEWTSVHLTFVKD